MPHTTYQICQSMDCGAINYLFINDLHMADLERLEYQCSVCGATKPILSRAFVQVDEWPAEASFATLAKV